MGMDWRCECGWLHKDPYRGLQCECGAICPVAATGPTGDVRKLGGYTHGRDDERRRCLVWLRCETPMTWDEVADGVESGRWPPEADGGE